MAEMPIETVRVLVVSRESAILRPLFSMGESHSWQMECTASGWGAMERVQSGFTPDLLLLDSPHGDSDGLYPLHWLRRLRPELPIILICDRDDEPKQQEARRLGARDCLVRPLEDQPYEAVIRRHLFAANMTVENDILMSDDVEPIGGDMFFIGASPIMRNLRAQAELVAVTDAPVLILGESGSGKETAARLIHKLSVRSGFGFAKVNCAALPSELLEIELFGCERNGTEPPSSMPGKLELCDKGTIVLHEVTEMSMALQAKLLEVMQNKRVVRPGNGMSVGVDVRILATSTTNVESAISEKRLREDLYHRLSAYTIYVPPLRQRREEVPLLLSHFMRHLAKRYGVSPRSFYPAVMGSCQSHSWPGNLEEMEIFVKRYLMTAGEDGAFESETESENGATPSPTAVGLVPSEKLSSQGTSGPDSLKSLVQTVRLEAERNAIAEALRTTGWNRKAAARLLKVSYRTLLYKIERYHMTSAGSTRRQTGAESGASGSGSAGSSGSD